MPKLTNIDLKVGQALYQLQMATKYKRKRIKKYTDRTTGKKGYTVDYKDI